MQSNSCTHQWRSRFATASYARHEVHRKNNLCVFSWLQHSSSPPSLLYLWGQIGSYLSMGTLLKKKLRPFFHFLNFISFSNRRTDVSMPSGDCNTVQCISSKMKYREKLRRKLVEQWIIIFAYQRHVYITETVGIAFKIYIVLIFNDADDFHFSFFGIGPLLI